MLDWIGIQAYFPLSNKTNPDLSELKEGWVAHRDAIQSVSRKYGKPVVFKEIGYRSDENAAVEPWVWPSIPQPAAKKDLETQVCCYESFFQTFWHEPWFAGAYIWKWFPASDVSPGYFSENPSRNFTPQFKPAQEVLLKWYGKK